MIRKSALWLLSGLLPFLVSAQQLYFQHLGISEGLESNTVYCAFQDKEGYLWFGTDLGVSRFNGYDFENFNFEDGLTGNEVFNIYQDTKGRLWFLSFNGEFSFYKDGKFYNSSNHPLLAKLHCDAFHTFLFEGRDGTLYIGTYGDGLFIIHPDEQISHHTSHTNAYKAWYDDAEELKFFTASGIATLRADTLHTTDSIFLSKNYPRVLAASEKVLVGYGKEIYEITNSKMTVRTAVPNGQAVTYMGLTKDGRIYVGTRKGLFILSVDDWTWETKEILSKSLISHTLIDQEGSFWVTTLGDGIFLSPSPDMTIYQSESGLPVDQVTSLATDENQTLWVGMESGFYANIKEDQIQINQIQNHSNQPITGIRHIDNHRTVIASKANILLLDHQDSSYFNLFANDIWFRAHDVLMAGKMLVSFDQQFFSQWLTPKPLPNVDVAAQLQWEILDGMLLDLATHKIEPGLENELYLGTIKGLYKLTGNEVKAIEDDEFLLNSQINDLSYDPQRQLLYVATNHHGLVIIHDDKIVAVITATEYLSSNNCQSLFLDQDGSVWIGTTKSVDLLKYRSEQDYDLVNFGSILGLNATSIADIEKLGNQLYLASEEGLITYDLSEEDFHAPPPQVAITSMEVNAVPVDHSDLASLRFPYNDNSVSFRFLGLSSRNLGNLTYEYCLEGSEDGWLPTKSRQVTFAALKPGNYQFSLRSTSGNNQVSSVVRVPFVIKPPVWRTIWFRGLILLSIIALGSIIWWTRLRQLKQQYEIEKQLAAADIEKLELEKAYLVAEQKSGLMQMNPHFLFNSLNAIKGYYAQNQFQEANRFISKFSRLLRRILECNTPLIPLRKEVEIIDLYLELMKKRYDDIFQYTIVLPVDEDPDRLLIPPMVIQPLVENAVIHGIAPLGYGELQIHFYIRSSALLCTIKDNGVGFEQSRKSTHQSVGLENIRERLELMTRQYQVRCDLEISLADTSAENPGTVVTLQLPLKYKHTERINLNQNSPQEWK